MQSKEVKAFRQRLVRAGFDFIMIYEMDNAISVSCRSPSGHRINTIILKMYLHLYPIKKVTYDL